jgi:very-short-patch-repair endonuclease
MVKLQATILNYRVDFLINRKLIIEVDGKKYHNNEISFEADRYRDQNLMLEGYRIMRFPAKQIYREASSSAIKIIRAADIHS